MPPLRDGTPAVAAALATPGSLLRLPKGFVLKFTFETPSQSR
jgi:hypothetical protein